MVWNKGIKTGLVPKTAFKKGFTPWNKEKKGIICGPKRVDRIELNCKCGKKFNIIPSRLERAKYCRTLQAIKHRMRSWISWKVWRKKVFKRDGYKCIDCGKGGYLEPHHIIPLKENLKEAFNINNGITLCRPCHEMTMGKELLLAKTYFSLLVPHV